MRTPTLNQTCVACQISNPNTRRQTVQHCFSPDRVPTDQGNQGKEGKIKSKIPVWEKSGNFVWGQKVRKKSGNFIIEK